MISDEMLRAAAGEYEQALLSSMPEAGEHHSFSPKFEKKMRRLCHRVKYASVYSVLKRAACAVITIILCAGLLLMTNADVRAAVIGWIKEVYSSYTAYYFAGEVESDESLHYELTEIPEGYTLLIHEEADDGSITLYQDSDGRLLSFSYFNSNSGIFFVGDNDYVYSQVTVFGRPADLYTAIDPAHSNTIVWEDEKENMLFEVSAYLEKDSLIRLAESVSPIYDAEN